MTPEERAARRGAVMEGMIAKGYTRERAEEALGLVAKVLFGPGGRFSKDPAPCVICGSDEQSEQGGLCPDHTYDEGEGE